ncbi:hypothetical protein QTP70_001864, partial [Hemibagrus guttatus]
IIFSQSSPVIKKYCEVMAEDLTQQLWKDIVDCECFSLQLDESTDREFCKQPKNYMKDCIIVCAKSPDLNPIKMLCLDLKRAVHARCPSNLSQLAEFCKEEWEKSPKTDVRDWSVVTEDLWLK